MDLQEVILLELFAIKGIKYEVLTRTIKVLHTVTICSLEPFFAFYNELFEQQQSTNFQLDSLLCQNNFENGMVIGFCLCLDSGT